MASQVEISSLTRYPLPIKIIVDRGNKFLAEFQIRKNYGIKLKSITARNLQANSISEQVHQAIGNIILLGCILWKKSSNDMKITRFVIHISRGPIKICRT